MKPLKLTLAAALFVIPSVISVQPAHAATFQHNCGTIARMCLHYNSNRAGAEFGSDSNVQSFNPANSTNGQTYLFRTGQQGNNGNGQTVWNNAGSAYNWHSSRAFRVYYNSFWSGVNDYVPQGTVSNLPLTKNQDTSIGWA